MALYRTQPNCPYCGKSINSIHQDYSDLPLMMQPIGDSFIEWDYRGHNKTCKFHHLNKVKTEDYSQIKSKIMSNTFERRSCLWLHTPAEKMLHDAITEIEKMGADENLSKAQCLIMEAQNLVSDYIDGSMYVRTKPPVFDKVAQG